MAYLDNIALMDTIVVSGSAKGLVVQTGNNSYFGSIAKSIAKDVGETSFEEGMRVLAITQKTNVPDGINDAQGLKQADVGIYI